jgi:hypothetical protein
VIPSARMRHGPGIAQLARGSKRRAERECLVVSVLPLKAEHKTAPNQRRQASQTPCNPGCTNNGREDAERFA